MVSGLGCRCQTGWVVRQGLVDFNSLAVIVFVNHRIFARRSQIKRNEVQKLKDRVVALERALVDAHLDLRLEQAYLEIACEEGWKGSVDELKKKGGGLPPMARSKPPKS